MRGYIVNEKDRAMNSTAEEKTHMYERMAEKIYKKLIEGKGKLFKRIKMPSSREFNVWHLPALMFLLNLFSKCHMLDLSRNQ